MSSASQRYELFTSQPKVCVFCGKKASFYAVQGDFAQNSKFHLNLYGVGADGEIDLFTKDHIVPKSKGGKNIASNYQIACRSCNFAKGNNSDWKGVSNETI